LVGEKYKKVYQLGGKVTVTLKKADLLKRQLDFILVD
jgi:exoribonuclease R